MEDDIIAYLDWLECRSEFEHDNIIWGEDVTEVNEDDNCHKQSIFDKYQDVSWDDIPY